MNNKQIIMATVSALVLSAATAQAQQPTPYYGAGTLQAPAPGTTYQQQQQQQQYQQQAAPAYQAQPAMAAQPMPAQAAPGTLQPASGYDASMYPGVDVQTSSTDPDVRYVSGGTGEPGRSSLLAMQKDFNLKLMFADTKGPYLSDVQVTIIDSKGQTAVQTVTEGPYLLVHLKPGTYKVQSSYEGQTKEQKLTVGSGLKTANVFYQTNEM